MKSLGRQRGGGNFNLKGKKYKLCRCKCCAIINVKEKIRKIEDQAEMQKWKYGRVA